MTDFLAELREELLDGLERHERAPGRRNRFGARDRRRIGTAARRLVAVAVAAAAAVALAVQLDQPAPELERTTRPQVSRLEGFHASGLVAADGALWVTQYDTAALLRIDLQTGRIRTRTDVGGSPGAVIAVGGAVWVHDWEQGRLLKVEANTNRVVRSLAVGTTNGDLALAAGSVWAIDRGGTLLRVDPDTAAVTDRLSLGAAAPRSTDHSTGPALAAAGDTLWVVAGDGPVTEIDAGTGRILGAARGPGLPLETSRRTGADAGGLWISSPARREVVHIDARTRRVSRFPVHGDPGPLAIVDGRIWVGTLHDTGSVTRVTVLATNGRRVGSMPVPGQAVNIVPAPGGGAWVAFGENGTVSPAALRLPDLQRGMG